MVMLFLNMQRRLAIIRLFQLGITASAINFACTDSPPTPAETKTTPIAPPPPGPDYSAIADPAQHELALLGKEIRPEKNIIVFDYEKIRPQVKDDASIIDYLRNYLEKTLNCDLNSYPIKNFLETYQAKTIDLQDAFTQKITNREGTEYNLLSLGKEKSLHDIKDFYLSYEEEEYSKFKATGTAENINASKMRERTAYHELTHCFDSQPQATLSMPFPEQMYVRHRRESYADCFSVLMMFRKYGQSEVGMAEWLANARLDKAFTRGADVYMDPDSQELFSLDTSYLTHRSIRAAIDYARKNDLTTHTPAQLADIAQTLTSKTVYSADEIKQNLLAMAQGRVKLALHKAGSISQKQLHRPFTPREIDKWVSLAYADPPVADKKLIEAFGESRIDDLQRALDLKLLNAGSPLVREIAKAREAITGIPVHVPKLGRSLGD